MRLSVVLCEGYDDRSFWSGWLDGFQIIRASKSQIVEIKNTGYESGTGEYALISPTGNFVGVRPVDSDTNLLRNLKSVLRDRPKYAVDRIVISVDPDTVEGDVRTGLRLEDILREAKASDPNAAIVEDNVSLFDGAVTVSLVRWEVAGETPRGVPPKQTLERLVCHAIQAAYPERAENVADWLAARRDPPPRDSGKAFSWSYMAGWFPENGCDDFFRAVWRDAKIAAELRKHLEESGAWGVAAALAD